MKRWIIGFYAVLALLTIGASLTLMEHVSVIMCGILACVMVMVVSCVLLVFLSYDKYRFRLILKSALICLALIISVMMLHWPLRVAHFLSRPSLDRFARDVRAGRPMAQPTRVGLFTIREVEVSRHGIVCLWVDPNPAGKTGLVQCGPDYVPFNLWSMISLDDQWQFIAED